MIQCRERADHLADAGEDTGGDAVGVGEKEVVEEERGEAAGPGHQDEGRPLRVPHRRRLRLQEVGSVCSPPPPHPSRMVGCVSVRAIFTFG